MPREKERPGVYFVRLRNRGEGVACVSVGKVVAHDAVDAVVQTFKAHSHLMARFDGWRLELQRFELAQEGD